MAIRAIWQRRRHRLPVILGPDLDAHPENRVEHLSREGSRREGRDRSTTDREREDEREQKSEPSNGFQFHARPPRMPIQSSLIPQVASLFAALACSLAATAMSSS